MNAIALWGVKNKLVASVLSYIFFLAATEEGCQLSLPARTYAVAFPVSGMIFLNIVSLIRTVVFIKNKQLGQVLIY